MQPRKPLGQPPLGPPSGRSAAAGSGTLPRVMIPSSQHATGAPQSHSQPQTARRPSSDKALALAGIAPNRAASGSAGGSSSARAAIGSSSPRGTIAVAATPAASAAGDAAGIDGTEAAVKYDSILTVFEKSEVVEFEHVYYVGQHCGAKIVAPSPKGSNFGYDDDRGDYIIVPKDHIAYRYEVVSILGRGSFGQVVKVHDHKTNTSVALKIIRNKKRFHQQAQVEVRILAHLRDRDPESRYGIIKMIDAFEFRSHVCLTYELLSMNLYEYMKSNRFHPMPLTVVKKIGASLLISLAFMWRENIIHCDLKPENILLRQPNRTGVKVIDLGSACFENERLYTYIQSRFYRAPEIILGTRYTRRIDLWSYACVLCELVTGYPLFPGENETEQLACIMEILGPPPQYLIEAGSKRGTYFDRAADDQWVPRLVPNSRKKVRHPGTKALDAFLGLDSTDPFVDFVNMFLCWDPEARPSPESAMRHKWICDAYVGLSAKGAASSRKKKSAGNESGGSRRASADASGAAEPVASTRKALSGTSGTTAPTPPKACEPGSRSADAGVQASSHYTSDAEHSNVPELGGASRAAVVPHLPSIHPVKQSPRSGIGNP